MTPAIIGRDHPAGVLRAEIGRAADSHGGLLLVTGEAGIGKTTLVTGAMDEARRLGALVLSGSCWDSESAPGHWPWVQVVRGLRRSATPEEWAAAESAAGGGLSVMLGESSGAEAAEAFRLYDAVTTALVSVSQSRPLVVVIDDLHWADAASVKLLEFAARHTWFERLLLVGTYRDVEVESAEHPLRPLMLSLVAKATTVTLTGLSRDEVGALMTRTAGHEPDGDLVTEVHRRTGGNPFFVEQTARLWLSGSAVTAIAPGVRDAVQRRLSLLPAPVARILAVAATLGREFHRQVLAGTAAAPVPQVDRLLDQAVAARLVVTLGSGRFAFAHDLVRETLYDSLDEAQARRHHAAAVRAIDRSSALTERVLPAELARHAYLAGDDLEPARAVDHLLAAARDADRRLAVEESVGHYRRALERADALEPRRQATISLDLGRELFHAGDRGDAWQAFEAAAALSRELDDQELLARVALTLYSYEDCGGEKGRLRADLLTEAHGKLVLGGAAPPRPLPLDRLAQELAVHAAGLARRTGDDEALAFSLWARHDVIWGPGTAAEREELTDEMTELARRISDHDMEHFASSLRWVALLEQGDPRYLDQYHAFIALAEREALPRFKFASVIDQSIITGLQGRFAEAEALIDRAVLLSEDDHGGVVDMVNHLRWALWLLQGRYDELAALHRSLGERGLPYPHLLEAVTAVQGGNLDVALRHYTELADADEPYPRGVMPLWLRFQAQVAAATRKPELCERARADLAPYAGQWALSVYGCEISGPMDLWSALVDAAQERWDDAIDGYTAAYRSADRLRARPWSIEARSRLAEALLARGSAGDADTAAELLDEVGREAAEIGMRHIVERVKNIRAGAEPAGAEGSTASADVPAASAAGSAASTASAVAADGRQAGEFRFDGQVWSLRYGGRGVHMPDAKGLHDLHLLLGRPGTDIPAVQLLNPEGGAIVVAARRMGGDDVLDDEAKAQYRRRLTRLDEEIDRATELGDDRRAAEYDREREALLDELRAAAGLAGRTRRLGDEAERARKTVTARIRDTLRKLDERHPELAAHLRATVSTGATCAYRPDGETTWRL
ncbi:ATP-binding protein [Actinomadura sp. HBU206391]|uniref:ATP-binding protein n=1 Tax=Actinomadura sp. HBU206391 TaxID=2731692 RepID=UPI00164FF714|nr:AAA family ATPase [Actinomadura sp. HBU206391]MBC6457389.1 AAA family ATPase [Actinomadura sp. HBU206391]